MLLQLWTKYILGHQTIPLKSLVSQAEPDTFPATPQSLDKQNTANAKCFSTLRYTMRQGLNQGKLWAGFEVEG